MIKTKEELEVFISENWNKVNDYICSLSKKLPPVIYTSVDIRESKTKIAPVDNNLYPAGFNNLCALDLAVSSDKFKKFLQEHSPGKKIGVIPESHTKNTFYLQHLFSLGNSLRFGGHDVFYLSFDENLFEPGQDFISLTTAHGDEIKLHKALLSEGHIFVKEQKIDFSILNNDQSSPLPIEWKDIQTPIHPSPFMGWTQRSKVNHLKMYRKVLAGFGEQFNIDTSILEADFTCVENVDFLAKEGIEEIAKQVDLLKEKNPKVEKFFIKADQGTYGMGIMVVENGDEVLSMNRKSRNKMNQGKNALKFETILIQEGVPTVIKYDDLPAEITIYLVDGMQVGGFMRANTVKDHLSNLNAKGMVFKKFCISELKENVEHLQKEAVYSTVARLSTLATAMEIDLQQKGEKS